jgi:hypothetical protein
MTIRRRAQGWRKAIVRQRLTHIATGAKVRAGDVLVFAWTPDKNSQPILFQGFNVGDGMGRRSWFVRVDTDAGPGWWLVRKTSNGSMTGQPMNPADPQWWLRHPGRPVEPFTLWVHDSDEPQPTLF